MQLKSVKILNYRSIRDVTVHLDPKCRVLVGINESGKSNILRALSLLDGERLPSAKDDVREALPNEPEPVSAHVQFNFQFNKTELSKIFKQASSTRVLSKSPNPVVARRAGIEETLSQLCDQITRIIYEVDLKAEKKAFYYPSIPMNFELVGSWRTPNKNCPADFTVLKNGQEVRLSQFSLVNLSDYPDIPDAYIDPASIWSARNAIGLPAIAEARDNLVPCILWQYDEKNLLPSEIDIDHFATEPSNCIPLWNMFLLSGIKEISKELEKLKSQTQNRRQNFFADGTGVATVIVVGANRRKFCHRLQKTLIAVAGIAHREQLLPLVGTQPTLNTFDVSRIVGAARRYRADHIVTGSAHRRFE